jgi:hypothetical protein
MKILKISAVLLLVSATVVSCGGDKSASTTSASKNEVKKSPDQEMSEKIVGLFFTDDVEKEGGSMKDVNTEYFKDGKLVMKATIETTDENEEITEITMEISGTWKIENGYIKAIAEKVKTDPEIPEEAQKEMIADINKTNSADKIIELNDQKLIIENADGERKTWKRRVQ